MVDPVQLMCSLAPQPVQPWLCHRLVHLTGRERSSSSLVLLFLWYFFSSHTWGRYFCPRAFCSHRPPGCWPSLDNPKADWHLRCPFMCMSLQDAPQRWRGGPSLVFFSLAHILGKRVSAQLAAYVWHQPR